MKVKLTFICLTMLLVQIHCNSQQKTGTAFYVSLAGNDSWSGRLPASNKAQTDGPFASLQRAQIAVREFKQNGPLPKGGITVFLRQGDYSLSKTLRLTAEDSGAKDAPIIWRALAEEKVSFSGSKALTDFASIKDSSLLQRIDKALRDKIHQIDLKANGIVEYGEITPRGGPGMELFWKNQRMTLARYPNAGWLRIADVPQSGAKLFNLGLEREKRFDGVPVGRHYGRISFSEDRPKHWSPENEIYLHGYWTWDWSDSYQRVRSIDAGRGEITIAEPHHHYGYTKNQRYYFLNVLEELDQPGEWVLDRKKGILYFWPPTAIADGQAFVSVLDEPLISLDNCEYVTIQGIKFQYSRGSGIALRGGKHNLVAGCAFSYLGKDAVIIDGGQHNGVSGCDIFDVAMGGIILKGGDRKTLTPAHNFATNNHIHHFSQWVRTSQLAVNISGVGNRIANNLIHDAPHEGIYLSGNEHLVEYNEIHSITQETGDAGAIHTGRDWTWRGNVIRYNYIHDLQGPGLHGVMGIYLDDWASGFTVFGNVLFKAGRATLIGGGRDNVVENNVYIQCSPSLHVDARGLSWAGYYFDGTLTTLEDRMKEVDYSQPPYSEKYPQLLKLYEDEPAVPKNNKIVRNVSYGGRWIDVYDYWAFDFSLVTMKDNLIADPELCRRRLPGQSGWDPYYLNIDLKEGYETYRFGDPKIMAEFKDNQIIDGDPGFVDLSKGNFLLKKDSPAFKLGFRQIPVEKIGLYKDDHRKQLAKRGR